MKTYLIDFENVNDLGMNGIHDLPDGDRVYIVYTNNANKICLDWFDGVRASISVVRVESGSQSLDMHLVSFLGYLLGQEETIEDQYVIISQDNDYMGVANFWCSRYGNHEKVVLSPSICGEPINHLRPSSVTNHDVLVERIRAIIKKHGSFTENGRAMLVSSLCTHLNNEISFQRERERLGLKGMKLLSTCNDVIDIIQYNKSEWAVLVGTAWSSADTESINESVIDGTPSDDAIEVSTDANFDTDKAKDFLVIPEDTMDDFDVDLSGLFDNAEGSDVAELNDSVNEANTINEEELQQPLGQEQDEKNGTGNVTVNIANATDIKPDYHRMAYDTIIKAGYSEQEANSIAVLMMEGIQSTTKARVTIYHSFLKAFGRDVGGKYYNLIKWIPF